MTKERRATEERRTEIADAALDLIGRRGIAALTVASLAEAVGLTPGALYRHFASREEILEAAVRRAEALLLEAFPDEGLPPLERLGRLVQARSQLVARRAGLARLVFSEQVALAVGDHAAARLGRVAARTRAFIERALEEAAEAGQIRDDLPPAHLAVVVMGTTRMMAFLRAQAARGGDAPAPADDVWDTLTKLLTSPST